MSDWIDPKLKKAARTADLNTFLRTHHPHDIKITGDSIKLKNNNSVTLKRGYSGWQDWSTEKTGNSIDFLMNYLDYDFQEAVIALTSNTPIITPPLCLLNTN